METQCDISVKFQLFNSLWSKPWFLDFVVIMFLMMVEADMCNSAALRHVKALTL